MKKRPIIVDEGEVVAVKTAIRKKPWMYFSRPAGRVMPDAVAGFVEGLALEHCLGRESEISIRVEGSRKQVFTIQCRRLKECPEMIIRPSEWSKSRSHLSQGLLYLVGTTEQCCIERFIDGSVVSLVIADNKASNITTRKAKQAADFGLIFTPHGLTHGRLSSSDFHRLGGLLRDLAVWQPGLSVSLESVRPAVRMAWQYPQGLANLIQEMDHSRWPLHPGEIKVTARSKKMKLSLCLRFVHAGSPYFRSWVNLHPTLGGAHWVGLGDALEALFQKESRGCRPVLFVTDPDTGAQITLPHTFIGVMNLELPDPHYAGPTKDILMGEDVRTFVRDACNRVFKTQWLALREQRFQ